MVSRLLHNSVTDAASSRENGCFSLTCDACAHDERAVMTIQDMLVVIKD